MAILKMCPRCRNMIDRNAKLCAKCTEKERERKKSYDKTRDKDIVSFYNSKTWKIIRDLVKSRDNNLCLLCLEKDRISVCNVIHHVVEVREEWDKRLDKDNCISLCHDCHNKVHAAYKDKAIKKIIQEKLFNIIKNWTSAR